MDASQCYVVIHHIGKSRGKGGSFWRERITKVRQQQFKWTAFKCSTDHLYQDKCANLDKTIANQRWQTGVSITNHWLQIWLGSKLWSYGEKPGPTFDRQAVTETFKLLTCIWKETLILNRRPSTKGHIMGRIRDKNNIYSRRKWNMFEECTKSEVDCYPGIVRAQLHCCRRSTTAPWTTFNSLWVYTCLQAKVTANTTIVHKSIFKVLNENNSFISCTFRGVHHDWHDSERFLEGSGGSGGYAAGRDPESLQIMYAKMEWDRARYLNYACFCFINPVPPLRMFEESSFLIYTLQGTLLKHRAEWYGACRKEGVFTPNARTFSNQFSRF